MGNKTVPSIKKYRGTPGFYVLLAVSALLFCSIAILIASGMRFQFRYRAFVHALSDATVYCYENNSLQAQLEEDTVRVTGDNAYDLYFLFSKKQAKHRLTAPEDAPDLVLDYGNGALLECWSCKMERSARRTYGVFWRFTSPDGTVWMYDTDDLGLYKIQRIVSAEYNEPW